MNTESAIATAIERLDMIDPDREDVELQRCIERLITIGNQRGCEHFDKACDGTLTNLIDIIIDG
jgi:hypothetical protein